MKYINELGEYYNGRDIIWNGQIYISPSEDILILAGYTKVEEPTVTEAELLELEKIHKLSELSEYDRSDNVNIFYLNSVPLWLDSKTRQLLRISIEAYDALGMELATKWFNGQSYTFPIALWITMLNSLEVYAAEALNVTELHRANIMNLNTIEDIEEYDYTVGYPQKVQFNL